MRILSLTTLLFVTTVAAAGVPPVKAPVAEMVEGITCASDPSQTYTLYLPKAFDGSKRWPVWVRPFSIAPTVTVFGR